MKKVKVLVTGACGFIGSHLVDKLIERGYFVIATDLDTAPKDFLNLEVSFVPADLTKKEEVANLFALPEVKEIEILFHLGAIFDFFPPDSIMFKNNVVGTQNILRGFKCLLCRRIKRRFILYSSGAIYGNTSEVGVEENFSSEPRNAYERSKVEQEKALEKLLKDTFACNQSDCEIVIIRPTGTIGPRSRYGVAKLMEFIAGGQLQFFMGKKNLIAQIVHIEDLVNATIHLAKCDWETLREASPLKIPTFNVVDDSRYSFEELMKYAAGLLKESHGARIIPVHLPIWLLKFVLYWQSYLAKKFNTKPRITDGLLDFFKGPTVMSNFALKAAGFTQFKYPDTKDAIKATVDWYVKEGWV